VAPEDGAVEREDEGKTGPTKTLPLSSRRFVSTTTAIGRNIWSPPCESSSSTASLPTNTLSIRVNSASAELWGSTGIPPPPVLFGSRFTPTPSDSGVGSAEGGFFFEKEVEEGARIAIASTEMVLI